MLVNSAQMTTHCVAIGLSFLKFDM